MKTIRLAHDMSFAKKGTELKFSGCEDYFLLNANGCFHFPKKDLQKFIDIGLVYEELDEKDEYAKEFLRFFGLTREPFSAHFYTDSCLNRVLEQFKEARNAK